MSQADAGQSTAGLHLIPNGQPLQMPKPPIFPHVTKVPRSLVPGEPLSKSTSNGTPTPHSSNHGSVSSRDPSPIPSSLSLSSHFSETLSHSTPNLRMNDQNIAENLSTSREVLHGSMDGNPVFPRVNQIRPATSSQLVSGSSSGLPGSYQNNQPHQNIPHNQFPNLNNQKLNTNIPPQHMSSQPFLHGNPISNGPPPNQMSGHSQTTSPPGAVHPQRMNTPVQNSQLSSVPTSIQNQNMQPPGSIPQLQSQQHPRFLGPPIQTKTAVSQSAKHNVSPSIAPEQRVDPRFPLTNSSVQQRLPVSSQANTTPVGENRSVRPQFPQQSQILSTTNLQNDANQNVNNFQYTSLPACSQPNYPSHAKYTPNSQPLPMYSTMPISTQSHQIGQHQLSYVNAQNASQMSKGDNQQQSLAPRSSFISLPHPQQQPLPPTSTVPLQNQYPPQMNNCQQWRNQTVYQQPTVDSSTVPRQYPQQPAYSQRSQQPAVDGITSQLSGMTVTQTGFNKLWGYDAVDLLQNRHILPPEKLEPPKVKLHQEFLDSVNCSPDIFRCTLTKIPESNALLQKSRLPLGILIHPFRDLNHLAVIQCSSIVRCRTCRTYINPFVYFVDHKRWKCNLCFRVNELPEEFQYDPVSKSYGDPTRRPEIKSSTIEFIAPSEYMLRPPQPAVYLFVLDVSCLAVESKYLEVFCKVLLEELDNLPGDGRTQVGFITFDSTIHFYNLAEGLNQPQQMIVSDVDDIFLPCPDNLLVNLAESRGLVRDLIEQLSKKFAVSHDNHSALGSALQAAYKLMAPTGGRVTVFQSCLPNVGPGALASREDPSQRAGKDAPHLNPATDFYKKLALDCSGQQIAVDLFLLNGQYSDLATLSGISRFSGGCIHHIPLFKASNYLHCTNLERTFRRYLTRKIGFEAVMRIRVSRGLSIHTFHGNFFVRSTDLLSLPNVNPDAGFGMQVSVEENLSDLQNVCFQAALLYTSSKGERRIRVHTLCLPVATTLTDILHSADQHCIIGLLSKMAVDRSLQSSLSDARDAFINVAIDVLSAYKLAQGGAVHSGLLSPYNLRLLPLYILALLKYIAFRTGQSTRLDDRLFSMCQMKTLPLSLLIQTVYPDLYPVHHLDDQNCVLSSDGSSVPQVPRLHLTAEKLEFRGAFLMDMGDHIILYIGHSISNEFCSSILGVPSFKHIPEEMYELPELDTTESDLLRRFVNSLQLEKPYPATIEIIRDDSQKRSKFLERLIEDRTESSLSYYEFLQHLKSNIK